MRAALALGLLAACGHNASQDPCTQRADAIEARLRAQDAEIAQLQAIQTVVDVKKDLPTVDEGSADFAGGVVVPLSASKPAVLEAVANAEACRVQKTKQLVHIYAVSNDDAVVGESAAWLARASKSWGVSFDLRRVVHLSRKHDVFPWPARTQTAQALAKKVFATETQDTAAIGAELSRVKRGCDAISTLQNSLAPTATPLDYALVLPRGLRQCNCSVPSLDDAEGAFHLLEHQTTDVGWVPPPEDAKTARSVEPLACEGVADPIIISADGSWSDGSADVRPVLMSVLDQITTCRDKLALDHSAVVSISLRSDGTSSTTIVGQAAPFPVAGLDACFRESARYPVAQPSQGSEVVLIYLPAITTAP